MDRLYHVDTLFSIPILKIYVFWCSRETDRQTDRPTENIIWRGLGKSTLAARGLDCILFLLSYKGSSSPHSAGIIHKNNK
jgi:hypothetical protein